MDGYGLSVYNEDVEDAIIDIVFIHGLTGKRETTWTRKGICWPRDLLPQDIPKARVMSFGYDADVVNFFGPASQNRVGDHAANLLSELANEREDTDTDDRPIIFAAHSLGGIICMDALLSSKNSAEPHLQNLLQHTRAIAFLGTPHHGSDKAGWGNTFTQVSSLVRSTSSDIVNALTPESEVLARIQSEFHNMIRGWRGPQEVFKMVCFYEELPFKVVGVIVPKHSAILPGYPQVGIHATHTDMVRFETRSEPGYRSVLGYLRRWVRAVERGMPHQNPNPSPSPAPPAVQVLRMNGVNIQDTGVVFFGPVKADTVRVSNQLK